MSSAPDSETMETKLTNSKTETKRGLLSPATDDVEAEKLQEEFGWHGSNRDPDTRCGFWMFQASWLQPCARIETFTGLYSVAALITSTLNVYVNSQITTLERQFGFSSTQTGIIMAANDLGFLVCVLFLSYSASKFHIPRALGVAACIFGLSGLFCSLPFFLFRSSIDAMVGSFTDVGRGNVTTEVAGFSKTSGMIGDLCLSNKTVVGISEERPASLSNPTRGLPKNIVNASLVIIFFGMMLQGMGKSPRNSFTVTYIDNNTGRTNTGFYMGIIIASAIFGPTLAFALGGVFSRMFVTLEETSLTPQHPNWIGAWWLGYIVCGALALMAALPLMWFPRRLPRAPRHHGNEKDHSSTATKGVKSEKYKAGNLFELEAKTKKDDKKINKDFNNTFLHYARHMKSFLRSMARLLTNPVYMSVIMSTSCAIFSVSGLSAYTPKYIEQVFDMPTYMANYILSANILCSSCLGTFIGGYLSRRFKMTARPALLFVLLVQTISMIGGAMGFVFACEQPAVHNWPESAESCNNICNCEDNSFFAVCGSDGQTYYSPCTAGCQEIQNGIYQNCTCIQGQGEASTGMCPYACGHIYAYFIAITIRGLFGTLSIVPKLVVIIRCVSPKDKGLAVGFSAFIASLLGWLLGPIVFGYVIDGICTVWDVSSPGVRGRCLLYDNDVFRLKIHGYSTSALLVGITSLLFGYIYARCTGCLDDLPEDAALKGQGQGKYQKVAGGKNELTLKPNEQNEA